MHGTTAYALATPCPRTLGGAIAIANDASLLVSAGAGYGGSAAIYGGSSAVYGGDALISLGDGDADLDADNAFILRGSTAIYGGDATICGRDAASFGGGADMYSAGTVPPPLSSYARPMRSPVPGYAAATRAAGAMQCAVLSWAILLRAICGSSTER
eukprot:2183788-Rhodomonas_salina.6